MRALSLMSSGIDSPVATYLMKKKMDVECISFYQGKFGDKISLDKVNKLASHLGVKVHIVDIEKVQAAIVKNCKSRFTCVLCKRSMYKMAEVFAKENGFDYLLTGENLGQVASQTLDNLAVNDKATSMTVIRPLIGYDKQEIIDFAKKIGTYEISIIKTRGCGALPKNPATKATLKAIEFEESKLDKDLFVIDKVK